jgi:UDPglucose 6-dehydrogenase
VLVEDGEIMRISIIGAGYVGLVTGACLAEKGHEVVCVDVDEGKVAAVNSAASPMHERGLDELLRRNVGSRLRATGDLRRAVFDTDLSIIAVGTPVTDGKMDVEPICAAVSEIGAALREKADYHVVAVKSTVVPGTTSEVLLPILENTSDKRAGVDFGVGVNPEFLREGHAVHDFMDPDRIVLGGIDGRTIQALEDLHACFDGVEVIRTNPTTAEAIKYASNALLATMVSFANEIGNLCAELGDVDAMTVMRGVHLSRNLSVPLGGLAPISSYLVPGCGFGGSCLPKDVAALVAHGRRHGRRMALLEAVLEVNAGQPREVITLLGRHLSSLDQARVAVLGLAFKPDTDDVRDSPALRVIELLLEEGADVQVYDPVVTEVSVKDTRFRSCSDLVEAVRDVEAVVLVTRWSDFEALPDILAELDPQPMVIDGRRMLDPESVERYDGIGNGASARDRGALRGAAAPATREVGHLLGRSLGED